MASGLFGCFHYTFSHAIKLTQAAQKTPFRPIHLDCVHHQFYNKINPRQSAVKFSGLKPKRLTLIISTIITLHAKKSARMGINIKKSKKTFTEFRPTHPYYYGCRMDCPIKTDLLGLVFWIYRPMEGWVFIVFFISKSLFFVCHSIVH